MSEDGSEYTKEYVDRMKLRGDPATDEGWLVDTPWKGFRMAVFSMDRDDAIRQAEEQRDSHLMFLEDQVRKLREIKFEARRVEAIKDV